MKIEARLFKQGPGAIADDGGPMPAGWYVALAADGQSLGAYGPAPDKRKAAKAAKLILNLYAKGPQA